MSPPDNTFKVKGVNGGAVFRVGPEHITPRAVDAAMAAKAHVLREAVQGLNDLPDEIRAELISDAQMRATLAQAEVMVWHVLCRIDPNLKGQSMEETIDLLEQKDFERIAEALNPDEGKEDPLEPKAPQAAPVAAE